MGDASRAIIRWEQGPDVEIYEEPANDGDNQNFTASVQRISRDAQTPPKVMLWGMRSGAKGTPGTANDTINITLGKAVMPDVVGAVDDIVTVPADMAVSVSRAATLTHIINAVTIDNTGSYVVIAGTEGSSFSTTPGAAGGPPFIPVDSVLCFEVRFTSGTAALVKQSEIKEVRGINREESGFPALQITNWKDGKFKFSNALKLTHTGGVPRKFHIRGFTVVMTEEQSVADFVEPAESISIDSTPTYGGAGSGAVATVSTAVGAGSFNVFLNDGIEDAILEREGRRTYIEYRTDVDSDNQVLCNGFMSFAITRPASGPIQAAVTIGAEEKADRIVG